MKQQKQIKMTRKWNRETPKNSTEKAKQLT